MLNDGIFLLSILCMKDSWRAGIPAALAACEKHLLRAGKLLLANGPVFRKRVLPVYRQSFFTTMNL